MSSVRIAAGQINTTVGDFDKNTEKIIHYAKSGATLGADIILFPELCVCGYPPEDLMLQRNFLVKAGFAIDEIARRTARLKSIIIVGFPESDDDTYNSAAVIWNGRVWTTVRKMFLPNYGVFDEKRYFAPGRKFTVLETPEFRFGVGICEDIWHPEGPASIQTLLGDAELILTINASPYHRGKREFREKMIGTRASDLTAAIVYLNAVGGQDELVFDGQSFACNTEGEIIFRAPAFEEGIFAFDIDLDEILRKRLHDPRRRESRIQSEKMQTRTEIIEIPLLDRYEKKPISQTISNPPEDIEEVWLALCTGLKDYITKNRFKSVIIGLSGGIDSALVAALAADVIDPSNIYTIFMPTKFTSPESYKYAELVAKNLGVNFITVEIQSLFEEFVNVLNPIWHKTQFGTAEENIQSRIRGTILMALSNKYGHLVLATGNKSEMSVGYATLYGDMVGGFAVLKDVPKTLVWELARWQNKKAGKEIIPQEIIDRAPTAELRENQFDTDSLPPYEILDKILELYIEDEASVDEIVSKTNLNKNLVESVTNMVDKAEYKRRQSAPGIKITPRAFGKERRMPITRS